MKITFHLWESGDWLEVYIDDKLFYKGHSLGIGKLIVLLETLGHTVKVIEIPEE